MGVAAVARGQVFLLDLDPTRGGEIRKTRPCLVVSPDELNAQVAARPPGKQPPAKPLDFGRPIG